MSYHQNRPIKKQVTDTKINPGTGNRSSNVGDPAFGHGTHVAGSVAGASIDATATEAGQYAFSNVYNGAAPWSKLAFDDVSMDGTTLGAMPADLNTGLFPVSYWAGARIHSNSWGSSDPRYTLPAMDMDRFVEEHPDFLILVAAGNDGPGDVTIRSPATAKNVLAVGAGYNAKVANIEYGTYTDALGLEMLTPASRAGSQMPYVQADFGPKMSTLNLEADVVVANPELACAGMRLCIAV
jgi:hypothetical protein